MSKNTKRKIIIENTQAVGDNVVLSSVIRDLKLSYPKYKIDVRTSCDFTNSIFDNNPHIDKIDETKESHEHYRVGYSAGIKGSKTNDKHFSTAFIDEAEKVTGLRIKQTSHRPDLHLSNKEKDFGSIKSKFNLYNDYWIINAGYKTDIPAKYWGGDKWKKLVRLITNNLAIQVVQVGEKLNLNSDCYHIHQELEDVNNLIGKTTIRDLITLVYHAKGVITPISCLMHIAGAFKKSAIVIAGGREPRTWEMYQDQRFLDTIGLLPCCKTSGCWRSGRHHYENGKIKDSTCLRIGETHPMCMEMITVQEVYKEWLKFSLYLNA